MIIIQLSIPKVYDLQRLLACILKEKDYFTDNQIIIDVGIKLVLMENTVQACLHQMKE